MIPFQKMNVICAMGLLLCGLSAAPAESPVPKGSTADNPRRPEWILGDWYSSPHHLTLRGDGSASFLFAATLSGELTQFKVGATGKDTWALDLRDGDKQHYWLDKIGLGYQVRRGRTDSVVYVLDPIARSEVPFYRVSEEVAQWLRRRSVDLEKAERRLSPGSRDQEVEVGRMLRELREGGNVCPPLTAQAALVLARALEQRGDRRSARVFYDYCVRLREGVFEMPNVELTRAYFYAGGCVDRESGYAKAMWYRTRAMLVQHRVLAQVEAGTNPPTAFLQATRAETAAVYFECAKAIGSAGYTPAVLALYPAAYDLALRAGQQPMADAAALNLFNYLLSRPSDHRHTRTLFALAECLEQRDARQALVYRAELPGWILRLVRLAQEMPALTPPRPDLARRQALRAVAIQRMGRVTTPEYLLAQVLPELIQATGIGEELHRLQLPGDDFWPAAEAAMLRSDWLKQLDAVAGPVDLAREFPQLELAARPFPQGSADLDGLTPQLDAMLPGMLELCERPSPEQTDQAVKTFLANLPP